MIKRHDTILPEYTNEQLEDHAKKGHWQVVYAQIMLSAPPECRQGIAMRADELMRQHRSRAGLSWDAAHQKALDELRAQGVPIHTYSTRHP